MNPSYVLLLAFLIGVNGGLSTMTAPAVVAWAANRHCLILDNSTLGLIGSLGAVLVFTLGALGELVIDKLPSTPNRTRLLGLVGRSVLGGLCRGAVDRTRHRSWCGRRDRRRVCGLRGSHTPGARAQGPGLRHRSS
jgi:uncharacterized membrane protein